MQDRELYQQIWGLSSPWTVERVDLDAAKSEVHVYVEHPRGTKFCCPKCSRELACYDHAAERQWRHLDTCQFKTILHARQPRVECSEHGVQMVNVPWAEKSSRFTLLFERLAIDILKATQTVTGAMAILRTSWDETWHMLRRAVERGLARKAAEPTPRLGIDEKAFAKGQSYVTFLVDLDKSTVEAIADGNSTESAKACFSQLSEAQIESIEAIAMDMSSAELVFGVPAEQQDVSITSRGAAALMRDKFEEGSSRGASRPASGLGSDRTLNAQPLLGVFFSALFYKARAARVSLATFSSSKSVPSGLGRHREGRYRTLYFSLNAGKTS